MLPAIIIGGAILFCTAIATFESGKDGLSGISKDDISENIMIDFDKSKISESDLKRYITRKINALIPQYKKFKIGKTGDPNKRAKAIDYSNEYSHMILLCMSKDLSLIASLEGYYTTKYINNPKNDNQKEGSAGVSKSPINKHFLYLVVK